jgi:hypothetical protein
MGISILAWLSSRDPHIGPRRSQNIWFYYFIFCSEALDYVVKHRFQQYFSYIVVVRFIDGKNGISGENHRPATGQWQMLLHKVVSGTPPLVVVDTYLHR